MFRISPHGPDILYNARSLTTVTDGSKIIPIPEATSRPFYIFLPCPDLVVGGYDGLASFDPSRVVVRNFPSVHFHI